AALATSCVLDGEWTFGVDGFVSAPRTIWAQIPQASAGRTWTLEARSEWALTPATATISATPIMLSSDGKGHYTGTVDWVSGVPGTGSSSSTSLRVEAIATANYVAVFEPTRMLLPDGHAVFPRDPSKATMLSWLTSGTSQYNVKLTTPFTYDATKGQLSAP